MDRTEPNVSSSGGLVKDDLKPKGREQRIWWCNQASAPAVRMSVSNVVVCTEVVSIPPESFIKQTRLVGPPVKLPCVVRASSLLVCGQSHTGQRNASRP